MLILRYVSEREGWGSRGTWASPPCSSDRDPLSLSPLPPPVLFHMYDSDSDGRITLEEYRNVKYAPRPAGQGSWPLPARGPDGAPRSPCVCLARQVVEELLSGNPHIEKESARSIADGAMMEAASVCVGQMVSRVPEPPSPSPRPASALPCPAGFWKAPRRDPQHCHLPPSLSHQLIRPLFIYQWLEGIPGLEMGGVSGGSSLGSFIWHPGVELGVEMCVNETRPQGWHLWRGALRRPQKRCGGQRQVWPWRRPVRPRAGHRAENRGLCMGAGDPWRLVGVVLVSSGWGVSQDCAGPVRAGPHHLALVTRGAGQPSVGGPSCSAASLASTHRMPGPPSQL